MGKGNAVLLFYLCFVCVSLAGSAASSEMEAWSLWESNPRPSKCGAGGGLLGECFEDEEMLMDSEINRRILATRNYISYGALGSNRVPCLKRGTSYYNCRGSGQANPYQRSCSKITRCARDTS